MRFYCVLFQKSWTWKGLKTVKYFGLHPLRSARFFPRSEGRRAAPELVRGFERESGLTLYYFLVSPLQIRQSPLNPLSKTLKHPCARTPINPLNPLNPLKPSTILPQRLIPLVHIVSQPPFPPTNRIDSPHDLGQINKTQIRRLTHVFGKGSTALHDAGGVDAVVDAEAVA
jgi:hypothetical protein